MMHSPTYKEQSILLPRHSTCAPIVGLYLTLIQFEPLPAYIPSTISLNLLLCSSLISISPHINPPITIRYISSTPRLPSLNPIFISLVFILYIFRSTLPSGRGFNSLPSGNPPQPPEPHEKNPYSARFSPSALRYSSLSSLRIFSALSVDRVYTRACMRARTSPASAALGGSLSLCSLFSFFSLFISFL